MAAPAIPLFLHYCARKPVVWVLPRLPHSHSGASTKLEKKRHQMPVIPGFGRRSFCSFMDSSHSNFQARPTDPSKACPNAGSSWGKEREKGIHFGRCALLSAAAAFLIQCACGEESAIAATYSPNVVGSPSSSFSGDNFDHCNVAPQTVTSRFEKKGSRTGGNHAKLSTVTDGVSKQSGVAGGLRKPALLVRRAGPYLPRLKQSLLARQVTCSSAGTLPMASISTATVTNSLTAFSRLALALDSSVLRSSFEASVNLLSLCSVVVWMQRSGHLPPDTPVILSQVAFKLFIPCFLMSKVATTLTSSTASTLVALPLVALAQVTVGATLGKVACKIFFRSPSLLPAVDWLANETGDSSPSSLALAVQQQKLSQAANKKKSLITAACAFGNSLTLPLLQGIELQSGTAYLKLRAVAGHAVMSWMVFLSGVLGTSEDVNRAAGYLALYMVGWSPAMWSVGYKILTADDEKEEAVSSGEKASWHSVIKWIGGVMNPPLYGVLGGLLVGGTPLSHLFLRGKEGAVLPSTSVAFDTVGTFARLRSVTAGILSPLLEAASLLGTATLAVQTVVLATSLGAVLPKPQESSGKRPSLEARPEKTQVLGEVETSASSSETTLDTKAFWVISLVRLIMLPFTGILLSFVLQCCNMLPPDPVYRLVILAESAMPTAQNLVLLAQLNAGTRPLAGTLAQLLLRQYALSLIPITIWMAIFCTF